MNYDEYQKQVFDHLWNRYQNDNEYRLSVRQKASRGAEKNYFIGTENSAYFAFTFWDVPVYFPGSSGDLIDFIFWGEENDFHFKFQFSTSKAATGEQNEGDLELGYELFKDLDAAAFSLTRNSDENKMLTYVIDENPHGFKSISDLLKAFDNLYNKLSNYIDSAISRIKEKKPDWKGGRYDNEKFLRLIRKMHARIENFSGNLSTKPIDIIVDGPEPKGIQQPLNRILYGPPGTGKTYHTIDKAIQILDEGFYEENKMNRTALKEKFISLSINDWKDTKGQVAFITFHQSMSYEDFVEGIKPLKPTPGGSVNYDIEDGIFKLISKLARSNFESSRKKNQLLPFEETFEKFRQDWEDNQEQKFPLKTPGYDFTIIGFTNTSIQFRKASGGTSHTLSINTLKEQYYGKEYDFKQGVGIYYPAILNRLLGYSNQQSKSVAPLNYVLIIDEINRGNVSQIFGELITLIETDKRIGNTEALEIILPYSKDTFGVPANLYIIGTMNTADRSVEALDTALRRRFSFEEHLPLPALLSPKQMICSFWNMPEHIDAGKEWLEEPLFSKANNFYELIGLSRASEKLVEAQNFTTDRREWLVEDLAVLDESHFTEINLQLFLEAINSRLEKLLSKEHQIGHAFFINVYSVPEFYNAFFQKLIPQLQEYFYGDFGKIGLILGKEFVKRAEDTKKIRFADFKYEDVESLLEKQIYRISDFNIGEEPDYDSFLSAAKSIYA
jgi:5-methylcytosine-specific restriction endonuclease McrBC GTP-binding regulatory subunit McrB